MIKFFWWNTSLSHNGKQNCTDEDVASICNIINLLLNNFSADVLVLTEVSEPSIKLITMHCNLNGYSLDSEVTKSGRAWFDFCIIFKNRIVEVLSKEKIISSVYNEINKTGVHFKLLINKKSVIDLISSHWPSRLLSDSESKRNINAIELRDKINKITIEHQNLFNKRPNIILMGDYNEEPYSNNLTQYLRATRDKLLLIDNEELFFNPFWSELSRKNNNPNIGTYYYKSGKLTKWHTFDQIMYSSAIINKSEFEFKDIGDNIIIHECILESIFNNKSKIDHLPIFGILRQVKSGDKDEF